MVQKINSEQINLGNESAIDLLVNQNRCKNILANNLESKGIDTNQHQDTLEIMSQKVANIVTDNSANLLNCTAIYISGNRDMFYTNDVHRWQWIRIKNYLFYLYYEWNYIRCVDLNSITNDPNAKNNDASIAGKYIDIPLTYDNITYRQGNSDSDGRGNQICTSIDENFIYLAISNDNNDRKILEFNLNWNNNVLDSVSITNCYDLNIDNKHIYSIDINESNSKFIATLNSGGTMHDGSVYIVDKSTQIKTELTNIYIGEYDRVVTPKWIGDNEFCLISFSQSGDGYYIIKQYNLNSNNEYELISDKSSDVVGNSGSERYSKAIIKFKYNSIYRLIIGGAAADNNDNKPMLIIYNADNYELIDYKNYNYFGVKSREYSNDMYYTPDIMLTSDSIIIHTGFNKIFIFDTNFNLVNDILINGHNPGDNDNHGCKNYVFNNNCLVGIFEDYCKYTPIWFNKKLIYKRTQTIEDINKDFYYPITSFSIEDIDNGYFD